MQLPSGCQRRCKPEELGVGGCGVLSQHSLCWAWSPGPHLGDLNSNPIKVLSQLLWSIPHLL